jgi:hypothetical protein
MDDAQASDAARALAQRRWGRTVVTRAVQTVVERADQLDAPLLGELRQVTGRQEADDG